MSKDQLNADEIRIQGLVDGILKRDRVASVSPSEGHVDEDSITAFVEGNLLEREAEPILAHLAECGFCRNITAELVRLDMALSDPATSEGQAAKEPSRVSSILQNLFGGLFGSENDAVFAHEEKPEDEEEDSERK